MPVFHDMKVPVPVDEVLRRLGKKRKMEISRELARIVNEEVATCQGLMTPKGIYERFDISMERPEIIEIRGGFTIKSADLFDWMENCDEMVVLVVTVGGGINARTGELVDSGEVTRGMVVDAIGSETVEELANVISRIIQNTVRKMTTKRYSPGYGDWDLTDQKSLLDLVDAERIGVTVNASSQMVPEKSISAVIGLRNRVKVNP
jgi:hypothetical protein